MVLLEYQIKIIVILKDLYIIKKIVKLYFILKAM